MQELKLKKTQNIILKGTKEDPNKIRDISEWDNSKL